jgi:hypothetical protein
MRRVEEHTRSFYEFEYIMMGISRATEEKDMEHLKHGLTCIAQNEY